MQTTGRVAGPGGCELFTEFTESADTTTDYGHRTYLFKKHTEHMRGLALSLLLLALPVCSTSALAQSTNSAFQEQSFDALKGNKNGEPCKIIFKTEALALCDGQVVPRHAKVEYRYRDRTPVNNCNVFGWCVLNDHRFIIGWKPEGATERQSFTIVFRNLKVAENFNQTMSKWAEVTPEEMSR